MTPADSLPPTRAAALARIAAVQAASYERTRNHIDGAVTGLSPYVTHGMVTLAEVLGALLQQESLAVQHKLVYELGWREFFRHVWAHTGNGIFESLHAGPLPDDAYATVLPADIRQGNTGIPVIDQAVRTLYATGTLHNHARMWLASYVVHVRHVHWRAGADWLVAHLLDGDLASNHLSWQWVAGTASHKPYLFNADNVARYAPADWHSFGSVLDQSYEALDHLARQTLSAHTTTHRTSPVTGPASSHLTPEPALHPTPPEGLEIHSPDLATIDICRGRHVWLVHPWALRAPPTNLPRGTLTIGVYLREHHAARLWPEARWRWVDAAMAAVAPERWFVDVQGLAAALAGAASVRSVDDPHITHWLKPLATLDPAPRLFPLIERPFHSFSQWWTRATRGLKLAEELL